MSMSESTRLGSSFIHQWRGRGVYKVADDVLLASPFALAPGVTATQFQSTLPGYTEIGSPVIVDSPFEIAQDALFTARQGSSDDLPVSGHSSGDSVLNYSPFTLAPSWYGRQGAGKQETGATQRLSGSEDDAELLRASSHIFQLPEARDTVIKGILKNRSRMQQENAVFVEICGSTMDPNSEVNAKADTRDHIDNQNTGGLGGGRRNLLEQITIEGDDTANFELHYPVSLSTMPATLHK
jgi:hypothetical protein